MILIVILAAVLGLLWCTASFIIWKTQDENIFPGDGAVFGEHVSVSTLGGKVRTAERDGQKLRWYFFEAKNAQAFLLLFHGNGEGATERLDYVRALVPARINVALVEYPGYGGEPHPTHEWAVLRNSLAAYDEIEGSRAGLPVFVMGESLGTGVATYVSSLRRPTGLLLSTPYTSMAAVAKARYPWVPIYAMIRHPINSRLWAPHVSCPVLILHGTLDQTVPYQLGQEQAKNFKHLEHFETIEGAGHANLREFHQGRFWEACIRFIGNHC